jgi:hypothetical protein
MMLKTKHSDPKLDLVMTIFMVIATTVFLIFYFGATEGHLREEVNIQNLSLCSAPDFDSVISERILKSDFEHLYVCGNLISNVSKVALGIKLFKGSDRRSIFNDSSEDAYSPGFFYWEIPFNNYDRAGTYRVDVDLGHNTLSSFSFEIVDHE